MIDAAHALPTTAEAPVRVGLYDGNGRLLREIGTCPDDDDPGLVALTEIVAPEGDEQVVAFVQGRAEPTDITHVCRLARVTDPTRNCVRISTGAGE